MGESEKKQQDPTTTTKENEKVEEKEEVTKQEEGSKEEKEEEKEGEKEEENKEETKRQVVIEEVEPVNEDTPVGEGEKKTNKEKKEKQQQEEKEKEEKEKEEKEKEEKKQDEDTIDIEIPEEFINSDLVKDHSENDTLIEIPTEIFEKSEDEEDKTKEGGKKKKEEEKEEEESLIEIPTDFGTNKKVDIQEVPPNEEEKKKAKKPSKSISKLRFNLDENKVFGPKEGVENLMDDQDDGMFHINVDKTIDDISRDTNASVEAKKAYDAIDGHPDEEDQTDTETTINSETFTGKWKKFVNCVTSNPVYKVLFPKKLNIITGVMIPVILNIFGVILFLRLSFLVGEAGIWVVVSMFTLSFSVVLLTVLSISAIATNGKIDGGGAYYMISRTLGVEFGGAIGLIFFCANVFGGAMYVIGFVETFVGVFPSISQWGDVRWVSLLYASILLFAMGIIVIIGAQVYAKTALFTFTIIMVAIGTTIFSFSFRQFLGMAPVEGYTGWSWTTFTGNFAPSFQTVSWRKLFGILFPACTGFLAGANLSGDLSNPSAQIPKGTLASITFTYITYIGMCFLFAFTSLKEVLITNTSILVDVNVWGPFVIIGIFASTVSAGLSSLISGSRILQALAKDGLLPFLCLFKIGFGSTNEPRIGVFFTYLLIQGILFIGDLNIVAPLVTMFFVLAYMFTNLACFALSVTDTPNFRPRFKLFSKWTALLGTCIAIAIMFIVDEIYAAVTFLIMIIVAMFIHFYAPSKNWGDITRAIVFHQMRKFHLKQNNMNDYNVKYWRFKGLVLTKDPSNSVDMLRFVNAISKHKGGFTVLGHITDYDTRNDLANYQLLQTNYNQMVKYANWNYFHESIHSKSVRRGTQNLLQLSGMGVMRFNTLLMGFFNEERPSYIFPEDTVKSMKKRKRKLNEALLNIHENVSTPTMSLDEYMEIIKDTFVLKKGLVICRNFHKLSDRKLQPDNLLERLLRKKLGYIDIWLLCINKENDDIDGTISLILQLAYLVKSSDVWKKHHKVRVNILIDPDSDPNARLKHISELLKIARVNAKFRVIQLEANDFLILDRLPKGDIRSSSVEFGPNKDRVYKYNPSITDVITKQPVIKKIHRSLSSRSDHKMEYEEKKGKLTTSFSIEYLARSTSINAFTIPFPSMVQMVDNTGVQLTEPETYRVINSVIRRETDIAKTAVNIMTLPPPPTDFNTHTAHLEYQKILKTLTDDLPATMLVYSPSNVISTFI